MNSQNTAVKSTNRVVEIQDEDLPLHCPSVQSSKWSEHPKVYLTLDDNGEVSCPYCGTLYKLAQ